MIGLNGASRAVLIAAFAYIAGFAKTPEQLKSEFAGILPADMKARAAWLHKASDGNLSVYVTDSDSGTIRELTRPALFPGAQRGIASFHPPLITYDGSRVIFKDGKSNRFYTINWDGSGLRTFACDGDFTAGYWHDRSNNTDWVVHSGSINRTNVDKPGQRVLLWSNSGTVWPGWFTLSQDGSHVGMSQENQIVGIAVVPNGTFVAGDTLGCRLSIAPDDSYDFLFQTPYHRLIRMCDSNGVRKQDFTPNDSIIAWAKRRSAWIGPPALQEHDMTRWSNHRDYIMFYMNCTTVNPIIMRLSDQTWMYIEDGLNGYSSLGSGDLCVYSAGPHPDAAPVVSSVPNYACQVSRPMRLTVWVRSTPDPAVTATGLPAGVSLVSDTAHDGSVAIAGTPADTGRSQVILTAVNSQGLDADTFTFTVGIYNDTPIVNAGNDTTTRVGHSFVLNGSATDDGIVNDTLSIAWTRITGPDTGATIENPASLTSAVTFTAPGAYSFRLKADDGAIVAFDTVRVTVSPPLPFIILNPRPSEQVLIDGVDTIAWQIDPPAQVLVELSVDNGLNYADLPGSAIAAGTASWIWEVSDTLPASDSCYLRVTDYNERTRQATSGRFRLVTVLGARDRRAASRPVMTSTSMEVYSIDGRRLDPAVLLRGSKLVSGVHICRIGGQSMRRPKAVLSMKWLQPLAGDRKGDL